MLGDQAYSEQSNEAYTPQHKRMAKAFFLPSVFDALLESFSTWLNTRFGAIMDVSFARRESEIHKLASFE